jgi:hypothetical protein
MNTVEALHEEAMRLADEAFELARRGMAVSARALFQAAFEREREAANIVANELNLEPTRSVLYRSAATLALHAGNVNAAIETITAGLAGSPPEEVSVELRALLAKAAAPGTPGITTPSSANVADAKIVQSMLGERQKVRSSSAVKAAGEIASGSWRLDPDDYLWQFFQEDLLLLLDSHAVVEVVYKKLEELRLDGGREGRVVLIRGETVRIAETPRDAPTNVPALVIAFVVDIKESIIRPFLVCRAEEVILGNTDDPPSESAPPREPIENRIRRRFEKLGHRIAAH